MEVKSIIYEATPNAYSVLNKELLEDADIIQALDIGNHSPVICKWSRMEIPR